MKPRRPLILLDRDGTLIHEGEYMKSPKQVRFLPGVYAALRRLKTAGFPVVVVSNQSGVGRGIISLAQLHRVNARFLELLKRNRVTIDGLYWCPHHPDKRCACRKPKLGMVRKAARDLNVTWKGSIAVGDRPSDVEMGRRTGGKGILVLTGYGKDWVSKPQAKQAAFVAKDFAEAVSWILKTTRSRHE